MTPLCRSDIFVYLCTYMFSFMTIVIVAILFVGFFLIATERLTNINKTAVAIFIGTLGWMLYIGNGSDYIMEQHPEDTELKLMYGSLLLAQNKEEEAKFQFQLVTEMAPDNEAAWQQLLNMSLKSEDVPEIIRVCEKCIGLFPKSPEYYFYLGIGYYQKGNYQKSLETYQEGLKVIPKENMGLISNFYGQMGDIYYQMERKEEMYKAYDEALKYNENNVFVLNNYSYFLTLDKTDLKKAERMAAQCIKLEPDNATYLDTYAWVFFMQGNYTLAKIYIESALANDTTQSPELVDHYGDILFMTGEKEKAVEQWKKAKEMGKTGETLDRKIAEQTYIEEEGIPYDE